MLERLDDTIVAVATASGRGAVGIVRASGRNLQPIIDAVCGRSLEPRRATYLPMLDRAGRPIDQGLAIHFPAPNSFTGEDVLELQAHGGPVVLQLLLARCLEAGASVRARPAGPGEFTQRAFLNGKLDLAQAEAISDLIEASTEAAARSAARSLSGAFSAEIGSLAQAMIKLRTLLEAVLDFPDEDIDAVHSIGADERLQEMQETLEQILRRAREGALLREGIRLVIVGQPNVGKSSLLNALAGAELAIVTPVPGTTRDTIGETIQIDGIPIHVLDTAGLRETDDLVEGLGIARTWSAVVEANVVVFLHDLTRMDEPSYAAQDVHLATQINAKLSPHTQLLHVHNKLDAVSRAPIAADGPAISAATGQGLEGLRRAILDGTGAPPSSEGVYIARTRHVHVLLRSQDHIQRARNQLAAPPPALELVAEELRLAHNVLGEITGTFTPDDLLGQIFTRFCIGK
jgi:tRNA modification GTPase